MIYFVYEALGNKFIILNNRISMAKMKKYINLENVDGLIYFKEHPLEMEIYNKDGTKATMCGNGLRCFLYHGVLNKKLINSQYKIKVSKTYIKTKILNMSPFYCCITLTPKASFPIKTTVIFIKGKIVKIYTVLLGTLVHVLINDNEIAKSEIIKGIKKHFGNKNTGNICFINILSSTKMEVIPFERGVGYTSSCGTGNAASYYVFYKLGYLEKEIKIINPGGEMKLSYNNNSITLFGSASLIKKGIINESNNRFSNTF